MSYQDEDFLQLSALQHFLFCPRQCGLIHIEQQWRENLFTAEGRIMHEKVHESSLAERKGVKIEYGLYLSSAELGLTGRADVVEFHRDGKNNRIPFPIEYKRGRPKPDNCDRVQLCAQALCLEEMLKVNVPEGAFYYGKTRHKQDVAFNDDIRNKTRHTVIELHEYINAGLTAGPVLSRKCKSCSFIDVCMPEAVGRGRSVKKYLDKEMEQAENTGIA